MGSGGKLLSSLQNAEDAGLKQTTGILVSEPSTGVEYRGEAFDNYLGSPDHLIDEDPIISNRLYVLAIMFGVGFMLAALYIFKTRRRRITDEANEAEGVNNIGVDSPAIPE